MKLSVTSPLGVDENTKTNYINVTVDTADLAANLIITDISGNDKLFKFYLKPNYSENGVVIKNSFDLNRGYLKDLNTGELAIVNYVSLDLIFKDAGYFEK